MPARLLSTLLFLLSACSGADKDDSPAAEADADTDTDTDTDTDIEPTGGTLAGSAAYADGADASLTRAQMCIAELCVPSLPHDSSAFEVINLAPETYAFELVPLAGEDPEQTYATPLDVVVMDAAPGEIRRLETDIWIPVWDDMGPLQAGTFTSGRLQISVDQGSFKAPDSEAEFLAAVEVDPALSGLPLDQIQGTVVGMWYLGAFRAEVGGWAFSVAETGLPEGTVLHARSVHYESATWLDLGSLTVDASGTAVSDAGAGLRHLTTLVVVQEDSEE